MAGMLSAQSLSCIRGERPLFEGVGFDVGAGDLVHVRGANGSGKTSLLRMLAGLALPAAGDVLWNGVSIASEPAAYHRELLYLGHLPAIKDDLSGAENLQLASELDGDSLGEDAARAALMRFGLAGREDLPARVLSAGQKRRVLLARLLTRRARLWVLDEPFTALDVKAVDMLGALVTEHLAQGGSAVVTSHQPLPMADARIVQL